MARVVVEDCRGGQCGCLCVQFKHDGHKMVVAKNPEHWVPDASTLALADFSGSCKVQHPSEAVNVDAVLPLATRFKLKRVMRSSGG